MQPQNFDTFYLHNGIRRFNDFLSPPIHALAEIVFPKNSIVHVDPDNAAFPDVNYAFLRNHSTLKKIGIRSQVTFSHKSNLDRPVNLVKVNTELRTWANANKRDFKVLPTNEDIVAYNAPLTLVNYGLLDQHYIAKLTPVGMYEHSRSVLETMTDETNNLAADEHVNQFIFINCPNAILSFTTLRLLEHSPNDEKLMSRLLFNRERVTLYEIIKYIDPDTREKSLFNHITTQHANKVSLLITYQGFFYVLNLGKLLEYSATVDGKANISVALIKRNFLVSLLQLQNASMPNEDTKVTPDDIDVDDGDTESIAKVMMGSIEMFEKQTLLNRSAIETKALKTKLANPSDGGEEQVADEPPETPLVFDQDAQDGPFKESTTDVAALKKLIFEDEPIGERLKRKAGVLAENGVYTAAQYRAKLNAIASMENLVDPYTGKLAKDSTIIKKEDLVITKEDGKLHGTNIFTDPSMGYSSLKVFDRKYIDTVFKKDIVRMVLGVQTHGCLVTDYTVDKNKSVLGDFEVHRVTIMPLNGVSKTLSFKIPVPRPDGRFKVNGVMYTPKKQRSDLPIVKTAPNIVQLSSYAGKVFVTRDEKKVNDLFNYVHIKINTQLLDKLPTDSVVSATQTDAFDSQLKAPRIYSGLSKYFANINTKDHQFVFDNKQRITLSQDILSLESTEPDGHISCIFVGSYNKRAVYLKDDGTLLLASSSGLIPHGDMFSMLGIDIANAPLEYSTMSVFGKEVPVGVALGYYLGLNNLLKLLGVDYKISSPKTGKIKQSDDEWSLRFSDCKLILPRSHRVSAMLMGGFSAYHKTLKAFEINDFNSKAGYVALLENYGVGSMHLRHMESLESSFVDPITKDVLEDMGEPVTFLGLLIRATELILTDYHPIKQDMSTMRIKGFERFSGYIYKELFNAARTHSNSMHSARTGLSLDPYAVWKDVTQDQSVGLSVDINPIESIKQTALVTYLGDGGRTKETMTAPTRMYSENSIGVFGEGNLDSSQVVINAYMSADPKLVSLRGVTARFDPKVDGMASLVTTASMISPGATNDDGKRVAFTNIQYSHTVGCPGYTLPIIRTGAEEAIIKQQNEPFGGIALMDGEVLSITKFGIKVKYADGSIDGFKLGKVFGKAEGSLYPHNLVANAIQAGDKFKQGDVLTYNDLFFKKDPFTGQIILTTSLYSNVAIVETAETFEDCSVISDDTAKAMMTKITMEKSIIVEFQQNLLEVLPIGTKVSPGDAFCVIAPPLTSVGGSISEATITSLSRLAANVPTSSYNGVLEGIAVYYHGDKQDMSATVLTIANMSDNLMAQQAKSTGADVVTGEVNLDYRVAGSPLLPDTAEIKFFITVEDDSGDGNKSVLANQAKTIHGGGYGHDVIGEDGKKIDMFFGGRSIFGRVIGSPYTIGLFSKIAEHRTEIAVKKYFE